jgi:flagellar biosynthetic protein FliR
VQAEALRLLGSSSAVAFMAVLARIGPLFLLAPIFSSRLVPARIKLLLVIVLAVALEPIARQNAAALPSDPLGVAALLGKEAAIGLGLSLTLAVLVAGVQMAASIADTLVGFSFAAMVDPINNQRAAVMAQFYSLFATVVLLLIGGDQIMIAGLARSYALAPLGSPLHIPSLARLASNDIAQVLVLAVEIGAPLILALLVADCAFALVSRAIPQMNVFFVGLPVKILLAVIVATVSLPFVADRLQGQLVDDVNQALRLLTG